VVTGSPLTSSIVRTVTAPKSSGAPNGRFLHPVRAQVAGAGSVAGSDLALWEVPTTSLCFGKEQMILAPTIPRRD
jgi:hypothetical protein